MAARALASVSISFGLVSIPVKLYTATQSHAISFNLLHKADGSRLKQQYICLKDAAVVERADMIKGYEFAKDQYVTFTAEELKALEEQGTQTVDIIAFVPDRVVDPIYFDKPYYLAPDKGGARPYALLLEAMRATARCALAKWVSKGKQHVVQVRAAAEGLVLQQLLYADEVRSMKDLEIAPIEVKPAELELAVQLINQVAVESYDPTAYVDEVHQRVQAAIEQKLEGKEVVISAEPEAAPAQVVDLMAALRASLAKAATAAPEAKARKPARRAASVEPLASARTRAKK